MNDLGVVIFIYLILAYILHRYFIASQIYKTFMIGYEEGYNSKQYNPEEAFKKYIMNP